MTRIFTAAAFALAAMVGLATAQDASVVEEMALGDANAPVTVVEYASFTCPHCATFHKTGFPRLKEDYIDTGKVRYVFREVYFDRYGLWAGLVARCGGKDRYFGLIDLIFDKQREWTQGGDPAALADNLRRLGRSAGLDDEMLGACLEDTEMANALVADYQRNIERDNINATPAFVINGKTHSNQPYEDLAKVIDAALGG